MVCLANNCQYNDISTLTSNTRQYSIRTNYFTNVTIAVSTKLGTNHEIVKTTTT